jgi:hypothetical protein
METLHKINKTVVSVVCACAGVLSRLNLLNVVSVAISCQSFESTRKWCLESDSLIFGHQDHTFDISLRVCWCLVKNKRLSIYNGTSPHEEHAGSDAT